MQNLLPGLRKFSEKVFPRQQELFQSLAQGQRPHTLLITCSDSRIDPNLVTQTQPGELFVLRNAGNIVPPFGASRGGEEAAIEFAVEGLGVRNIVICGHSQCGAMAALMEPDKVRTMPCVAAWLQHAQATRKRLEGLAGDMSLAHVVQENVLTQVDNLRTHPSVSGALRAGRVQIFAWVYSFESGAVTVFDPSHRVFVPSTEVTAEGDAGVARFAL